MLQITALAKPEAKLPPSKWFDAESMQEVVANTKYIHPATGALHTSPPALLCAYNLPLCLHARTHTSLAVHASFTIVHEQYA